jgi:hypothetical protein
LIFSELSSSSIVRIWKVLFDISTVLYQAKLVYIAERRDHTSEDDFCKISYHKYLLLINFSILLVFIDDKLNWLIIYLNHYRKSNRRGHILFIAMNIHIWTVKISREMPPLYDQFPHPNIRCISPYFPWYILNFWIFSFDNCDNFDIILFLRDQNIFLMSFNFVGCWWLIGYSSFLFFN